MTTSAPRVSLGIYEKALAAESLTSYSDWVAFFHQVPSAGYSFVDLSVDETAERMSRLDWSQPTRRMVRQAAEDSRVQIGGICLSAHRKVGPGSHDPAVRSEALGMMADGLRLAHDLHVGVVQVAGYYCFYEGPNPQGEQWYRQMLEDSLPLAAKLGVTMAIENVDGQDVTSVGKAMEFVTALDSPYLQLYPDIGNIAEQGLSLDEELAAGKGHIVALHAKDVRRGEPRRVPMGEGIVDWDRAFHILSEQKWSGRLMVEMWNDNAPNSRDLASAAGHFIASRLAEAGIGLL